MPVPCTVTGNLNDLTNTNIAGFAQFILVNYGDNVPRILGTTMLSTNPQTISASGVGTISASIWGNDNIDPAGTFYYVAIQDQFGKEINRYAFNITGASFNLNTAVPITTAPVVTPPTGDTTYLRLSRSNEILNTLAFSATPAFNFLLGPVQSITLTGNVTSSTISGATAGMLLVFCIIQDGVGGRTFAWPANVKGDIISGTASIHNVQVFYYDGTTAWPVGPLTSSS